MKTSKHTSNTPKTVAEVVVEAVRVKKEIKIRVQNGENIRKVVEENGYKLVLPL